MIIPWIPSTCTISPVFSICVAFPQPTTAGIPNSLATIAAWERGAPMSVTIAETFVKIVVHPILVAVATSISP